MLTKNVLKIIAPHLFAVAIMTGASCAYFYPQLQGKIIQMDDAVSGAQGAGELKEYSEKTGNYYLWSNAQFGGMPRMMWVKLKYNKILKIYDIFKLGFQHPIGMYLAMMIFGYALYYFLGVPTSLAIGLAIATSLGTSNVMLWDAGHYSKIGTLVFTPLIILSALLIFEKQKYLWGGVILTFAMAASLTTQHPQMTYYIFIFFLVFGVIYGWKNFKSNQLPQFSKGLIVAIVASALALSIASTRILSVYDYSKHSMRGSSVLDTSSNSDVSSKKDGLGWEYSMQWSNDLKDLAASFLIPGFVGGGSGEKVSYKSESFKMFRIKNAPLYWGNLPFTVGPMYMGVSFFYLFVLGLFIVKGPIKWWIGLGVLLLTILSMGSNFESINKLFFNYMPMYDKFRAPSSVLNTVLFFLPVLGALTLSALTSLKVKTSKVKNKKKRNSKLLQKTNKILFISTAIVVVPLLFFLIAGSNFLSFEGPGDVRYQQQGLDISAFINDRKSLLKSDAIRSLLIVLSMAGCIWIYINKKLKGSIIYLTLASIMVIDVWGVSRRYVDTQDFVTPREISKAVYQERTVDRQIKKMEPNRAKYRIQDFTVNTFNTSSSSYLHNTIGGYDPAKLRRYQDIIEGYIEKENINVYNMFNTKYFIINGENGPQISVNEGALGSAWFIEEIIPVSTPDEEFGSLASLDPAKSASLLTKEFSKEYHHFQPTYDPKGTIELVDYEPNRLVYNTNTTTDQFAVFSEVWYCGNRDWVSYIDGIRTDHVRVNYILRGMKIPSGEHEITFKFLPVVYATGELVSLIGSVLFVLLIVIGIVYEYKKRKFVIKA